MKIWLLSSDKMTSSSLSIVSRKISIASRNLVHKPVTTRKANIFENLRNLCKSNTLLLCRNTSHLCETRDTSSQWFCCKSVKFNLPVDKGKGYMRPLPKCLVVFWPKCLDTFEAKMSGLFWPGIRTWWIPQTLWYFWTTKNCLPCTRMAGAEPCLGFTRTKISQRCRRVCWRCL